MMRLLFLVLLSGCSLINDFDRFTFGVRDAGELEHEAGLRDAGELEHEAGLRDAGKLEHEAGLRDAGELEHEAGLRDAGELEHEAGLRDAGAPDAGLCLDATMFVCQPGWQGLPCDTCPGGIGCFGPCD